MAGKVTRYAFFRLIYVWLCEKLCLPVQVQPLLQILGRFKPAIAASSSEPEKGGPNISSKINPILMVKGGKFEGHNI